MREHRADEGNCVGGSLDAGRMNFSTNIFTIHLIRFSRIDIVTAPGIEHQIADEHVAQYLESFDVRNRALPAFIRYEGKWISTVNGSQREIVGLVYIYSCASATNVPFSAAFMKGPERVSEMRNGLQLKAGAENKWTVKRF